MSHAYVAGRGVAWDDDELAAALRRALLVVAAGGDPHRELELSSPAVTSLAHDLEDAAQRADLERGLARLREDAARLPRVCALLSELAADPALAWRAYVCGLLAAELGDD